MKTSTFQLTNQNGVVVEFISQGGKIISVKVPEGDRKVDIALGYDTPEEFLTGDGYMGAICGRLANRIGNGTFQLEGKTIKLFQNDRTNHLHGGKVGFNLKNWEVKPITKEGYHSAFQLSLLSHDGDENYPGNLQVEIVYALNNQNEFLIDIQATTDKTTAVNLTSHPYFNLNGVSSGKIFNHFLEINADAFTVLSDISVPTGEIRKVKNSDMDFTKPVKLSEVINSDEPQIQLVNGLDHNWVINKKAGEMAFAARISEPVSGRGLEVFTTQPGIQVYTSMHFDGTQVGKNQMPFTPYCAIALEAQNFPDAPNHANFPDCILKPGETYHQKICYKFLFLKEGNR
ncbi:MAG: galactose mutarotase [Salinivirgaceae bacterium]|nr:galactose mutarotase [Salinivirgaceae bacterium]